ncbi:MAG: ATP-binding protein, partial [Bdellovibrionaceae bacterium]|nr:ATP-binding protein [Pseudobdellovibrionaceae bacterium]
PDFGPQGRLKGVVALITDISKAKRREEQAQLLLNATSILHGSLESEHMVARFARALVPEFASSVVVDLLDDARVDHAGRIRRVSSVHQDPEKARILSEELDRFPSHADGADSREPVLIAHVDSEDLARISTNEERQKRLIQIGIASLICIPLVTREKIIGALHFGRGPHECPFDDDDFRFAIDIGNRTTLALENLRLFQDVHAANRAKEEFLATVSHELRTPMNVILGWLEILRDEKPDAEETDSILQTLERNARVQVELINDLLDISRIVSGKLALQTRPLNIAEAVSVAVDSVRPAARAKSLHLNLEVVDSPPNIRADADRLHQVLWNLLTNAVKFTPLGGRIDVRVTSAQDGVTITIADTGQGIERRFLPYVFDRFRQEQGGSNRQHGGLGIGLAIVRYLIELHGGSVHAASEGKGKGATFTIHLPTLDTRPMLSSQELSTVPHQNPPLLPSQESRTQHASTHLPKSVAWAPDARPLADLDILLVDDSADVRMLIERILARAGATVRSVSSATEALHLLKKGAFDCLISDIGLPEVDGYELIQRARTMEAARGHERMPAAALTAYAAEKDAQRALEAGYDVHIPKPVHGQDLIRTVASLTRGHQGPTPGVRVLQGV